MSTDIVKIATEAYAAREAEQKAERQRLEDRLKAEAAEEDARALEGIINSPIFDWFPDVDWKLVDRRLPQKQVIVQDPASGLMFKVVPPGQHYANGWHVSIATPKKGGAFGGNYTLVDVRSAADVGRYLLDLEQQKHLQEVAVENA